MRNPFLFTAAKRLYAMGRPTDYYNGTRPLPFEPPRNIVAWFLVGDEETRVDSFHHRFILVVNLGCDGEAVIDHRIHALQKNTGLLIFPFQYHHFVKKTGPRLWLFIGFECLSEKTFLPLRDRTFPVTREAHGEIERLLDAYPPEKRSETGVNRTAISLAGLLNEALLAAKTRPTGRQTLPPLSVTLSGRVQRWLHLHLDEGVRIADAAVEFKISESRLRARFRAEMGQSLGRVLGDMRFERAKGLLCATEMKVSEIAAKAGFESVYAFSTSFKRRYGLSPRAFRTRIA